MTSVSNVCDAQTVKPALPGFESVKRYYDSKRDRIAARILPGEYYVSNQDEIIVTTLGSCVSVGICDPLAQIGGMNHFMLPGRSLSKCDDQSKKKDLCARYGDHAMNMLIETIIHHGGKRNRMEYKIFGGGKIIHMGGEIGENNVRYVRQYLQAIQANILAECVADIYPRKLIYYPLTGKALVKKLFGYRSREVCEQETRYLSEVEKNAWIG